jgi:hypothetical protein
LTICNPSSFPQTGSWSMVDLLTAPIQLSFAAMARYASSRVQPATVLITHVLCKDFRLTAQGRANVEQAVESLKWVGTLGLSLEFGFGVEHMVRAAAKSEQGTNTLAVCSALVEVYPSIKLLRL